MGERLRGQSRISASFAVWICLGLLSGCAQFHPKPLLAGRTISTFDARSLADPDLQAFMSANGATAPRAGAGWNLKDLTLAAFYYEPALAEARARLLASQAARVTAGERPNPAASVTPAYDSGVPGGPDPWIVSLALDWPIETAGKRDARTAQAEHLATAARWNLVGTIWQVRSRVRAALLDLYAARQSEALLARQVAARRSVLRLLEGQLAAGSVSSDEVTRARIRLDSSILARQTAAGQLREARVQLAAALGVPLHALAGVRLTFAEFSQFPQQLTRSQIRRRALLDRADVRAALEQYAAAQSDLQLQIAKQYPDIHLGPGYTWNAQLAADSLWQLGLTLTLPILNRNQGPIAEARARREVAAAHFLTVQTDALSQINRALAAYRAALARLHTATGLFADEQRRLSSIDSQVRAGERPPLDRAEAQLAFEVGAGHRLRTMIQAQQALGQLEDAVQSPLSLSPREVHAGEALSKRVQE